MKVILFLVLITILFIPALAFSQATSTESVTVTTYYPEPYGEYTVLRLVPTTQPACGAGNQGAIYYDNDPAKNRPYICDGTKWSPIGAGLTECNTFYSGGGRSNYRYRTCPSDYPIMASGGCMFAGEDNTLRGTNTPENCSYPDPTTNTWHCYDTSTHADVAYAFVRCCK